MEIWNPKSPKYGKNCNISHISQILENEHLNRGLVSKILQAW